MQTVGKGKAGQCMAGRSGRILVTGAGGFAGKHIAEYLFKQGYEVIGTVHHNVPSVSFTTVKCDLSRAITLEQEFDVIVHAAGSLPYRTTDFMEYKRNNVDAMQNLLDFAIRKRISRFIYLSTIGIYGEFRKPVIDEDSDRVNPDAYGLTKYMAECMLRSVSEIESISLRMPGIIGPGCRGVWFSNTVEKFRRNEPVTIYSPDFETKNFVWAHDLARFVDTLITAETWKYNAVNLACSQGASIREIVMKIKKLTESSSEISVADGNRPPFCLDASRAAELGYSSLSPLEIVSAYLND